MSIFIVGWWNSFVLTFVNYDLNQEGYTSLLWIFEGFTSYYDDLLLLRSGNWSGGLFGVAQAQIDRYLQNPGRAIQTVAESSFMLGLSSIVKMKTRTMQEPTTITKAVWWLYTCLDLGLRLRGSSLDALMQKLYANAQQGIQVHERTIFELCKKLTGDDWSEQIHHLINTTDELPLDRLLPEFGVDYQLKQDKSLPFGLKIGR